MLVDSLGGGGSLVIDVDGGCLVDFICLKVCGAFWMWGFIVWYLTTW